MRTTPAITLLLGTLLLAGAQEARAQDSTATEARPTGLPKKVSWTFNIDAGFGAFGFANSLYNPNKDPDASGDLSDNWEESFVKPKLSGEFNLKKSTIYAAASVVGERTFSAPPPLVGTEAASFGPEDLYIGWRSGTMVGKTENLLDFTVGRARYRVGQGMLLWDGAAEGGSRGGFWSNARQAWAFATIARVHPKIHTIEAFYLDRSELPEGETGVRLWGANYQLALGDATTLGATYLKFYSDSNPNRDGMNVFNVRANTAPFRKLPGLSLVAEYANESNGDLVSSNAWNVLVAYQLSKVKWTPTLSYRYAFFQGDDPATTKNEAFDPLFPGFYDWGTWWQGEIAGEYFLSNSNLISNQVRVSLYPSKSVSTGAIAYSFSLDQEGALTSKSIAFELDGYCDWKVNSNFTLSFVAAYANPGAAVEQEFNRTKNFAYGMVYVAYAY
jgi:hypothetical protein